MENIDPGRSRINSPALPVLLTLGLGACAVAIGVLITHGDLMIPVLLVGAIFSLMILLKPEWGFKLMFLSLLIPLGFIQRYFEWVPTYIKWIPFVFMAVSIAGYLVKQRLVFYMNPILRFPRSVVITFVALFALGVISILYNQEKISTGLVGLRHWAFLLAAMLLVALARPGLKDRESLLRFFVYIGLLQLPVVAVQRILFYSTSPDMMTGLFGTDVDLLAFQAFCTVAVVIWWLKKRPLIRLPFEITIVTLLLSLVFSNSKFAWIFLPLVLLFAISGKFFHMDRRTLYFLVFGAILIGTGMVVYENDYSQRNNGNSAFDILTDPTLFIDYNFSTVHSSRSAAAEEMRRGEAVVSNFNLIRGDPVTLVLGIGPGNLSSSRFSSGSYYMSDLSPRSGSDNTQLAILVGETGLSSVLLAVVLMALFFWYARQFRGSGTANDGFYELSQTVIFGVLILFAYYTVLGSLITLMFLAACITPIIQEAPMENVV